MITDENLPVGWTAASQRSHYDEMMEREFESLHFERDGSDASVVIDEVQEPNEFGGRAYQVVAEPGDTDALPEELGLYDDLDGAREAAIEFMADQAGG